MRKIKKAYRVACAMFGKKKVWAACGGILLFLFVCLSGGDGLNGQAGSILQEGLSSMQSNPGQALAQLISDEEAGGTGDADTNSSFDIEAAVITKITDGDTIRVQIDGRTEEAKVRMLEVNTPESVHADKEKNNYYGKEASEYTKNALYDGQKVYLTKDKSDTDRYGRLLRIVWTEVPSDPYNENELRAKCFNAKLLLDGYAEVAIYDDKGYQEVFTEFQEEAMRDRRGLWADDTWWDFVGLE